MIDHDLLAAGADVLRMAALHAGKVTEAVRYLETVRLGPRKLGDPLNIHPAFQANDQHHCQP